MIGDEIIAVNGLRCQQNISALVGQFEDTTIELIVGRMGRVLNLSCPHTNKSYYPSYSIAKLKAPSNLQKRSNFSIMAPSISFEKIKHIG